MEWSTPARDQTWGYAPVLKKFSGLEQVPEVNYRYLERIVEHLAGRAQQLMRLNALQQYLIHAPVTLASGESGTMWVQVFSGGVGVPLVKGRLVLERKRLEKEEEEESSWLFHYCRQESQDGPVEHYFLGYASGKWIVAPASSPCEIPDAYDYGNFIYWTGNDDEEVLTFSYMSNCFYGYGGVKVADISTLDYTHTWVLGACLVGGKPTIFSWDSVYTLNGTEPQWVADRIRPDGINQSGTEIFEINYKPDNSGIIDYIDTYGLSNSGVNVTVTKTNTITNDVSDIYTPDIVIQSYVETLPTPPWEVTTWEENGIEYSQTIVYKDHFGYINESTPKHNSAYEKIGYRTPIGYIKDTLKYAKREKEYGGARYYNSLMPPVIQIDTVILTPPKIGTGSVSTAVPLQLVDREETDILQIIYTFPDYVWVEHNTDWVHTTQYYLGHGFSGPLYWNQPQWPNYWPGWSYNPEEIVVPITPEGTDVYAGVSKYSWIAGDIMDLDLLLTVNGEYMDIKNDVEELKAISVCLKGASVYDIPLKPEWGVFPDVDLLLRAHNRKGQAIFVVSVNETFYLFGYAEGKITDLTAQVGEITILEGNDYPNVFNLAPIHAGLDEQARP